VYGAAFAPDSRTLAIYYPRKGICLYDITVANRELRWIDPGLRLTPGGMSFHPKLARLAVTGEGGPRIFDTESGALVADRPWPRNLSGAWWHPEGKLVAVVDIEENRIYLLDAATGKPAVPPLVGHRRPMIVFTFNPTGDLLASTDWSGVVRLWDTRTARP